MCGRIRQRHGGDVLEMSRRCSWSIDRANERVRPLAGLRLASGWLGIVFSVHLPSEIPPSLVRFPLSLFFAQSVQQESSLAYSLLQRRSPARGISPPPLFRRQRKRKEGGLRLARSPAPPTLEFCKLPKPGSSDLDLDEQPSPSFPISLSDEYGWRVPS